MTHKMNYISDQICINLTLKENGVVLTIISVLFVCCAIQQYLSTYTEQNIPFISRLSAQTDEERRPHVLLVTAHPDDECMFFAPSIISLVKTSDVFVLCLSTGNFYSKGDTRKRELVGSCETLGIPADNVFIVDDEYLPDNPKVEWSGDVILSHVHQYVDDFDIDTILTFDEDGVSDHGNHKAIYKAIYGHMQNNEDTFPDVYKLVTVNVLRKYIGVLDLAFTLRSPDVTFISDWSAVIQAQRAMFQHYSQLEWFRYLYILFSRYMIMNTVQPVLPSVEK